MTKGNLAKTWMIEVETGMMTFSLALGLIPITEYCVPCMLIQESSEVFA